MTVECYLTPTKALMICLSLCLSVASLLQNLCSDLNVVFQKKVIIIEWFLA